MSALAVTLATFVITAPTAEPLGTWSVRTQLSHDALAGRLAHDRRHGAKLVVGAFTWPEAWRAGALLDEYHLGVGVDLGWTARVPNRFGADPMPYDVAPNGYLYGQLSAALMGEVEQFELRYTIGATGDSSEADRLYGALDDLQSWPNAAEGEVAQNLWFTWRRSWLTSGALLEGAHLVDVYTTAETALGERRLSQSASVTLRLGWLRGRLPGAISMAGPEGWAGAAEAYVYGRGGLEVVAHDALIDGPFFNDAPHPHEVSSRPLVPVAEIGVVLRPARVATVGFALELRGAEVDVPAAGLASAPASHVRGRLDLALWF